MNRYSTITFEIEAEFDIAPMDDLWVTFKQHKTVITKKMSDGEVTINDNTCKVTLSQEETALFKANDAIAVQLRWTISGVSDSSSIDWFTLGDVLEEGVIGA